MDTGTAGGGARRIALLLQYDGAGFNGWQIQNGGRTVQAEVERALNVFTGECTRLVGAGRTDAGVHALGQVAHFDTACTAGLQRLCMGLNGILERSISVKNAYHVPEGFDARRSARSREYIYLIHNGRQRNPFAARRAMWVSQPLDAGYLNETASHLVGEMDFAAFCKKSSALGSTVRRIESIEVTRAEDLVMISIKGNAFLHNMVRVIVGTMCSMHKNGDPPSRVREILEGRDRTRAGATAPAHGLYLRNVIYDPPLASMESAFK